MYPQAGPTASIYPTPIAERTKALLSVFDTILDARPSDGEKLSAAVDNHSRFKIWAGNIGAYHVDARSLDSRIKDAPEVARRILELLDELTEVHEEIRAIVSGERQDAADDDHSDDGVEPDTEFVSELSELCLSASDIITSLLEVSALLRRAAGRDRFAKAAAAKDHEFLDQFDKGHVAEKFPKVESQPWLRDRLGMANVQRRQYLRYARKHRDRMAHEPGILDELMISLPKKETLLKAPIGQPQTVISSRPTLAPTKASTFDPEPMTYPTAQTKHIYVFDDTVSQATSVVTSSGHQEGAIDVVRLSELTSDGKAFECPYCWTIVQTRRQNSWRKHVLRDIRAWTCTFQSCNSGLFEDRDAWFEHELEHHRRQWTCHECPNAIFASRDAIEAHVYAVHPALPIEALPAIIASSSRPVTEIPASACPLCDEWQQDLLARATKMGHPTTNVVAPLHDFRRHLGQHLEQLALFAIAPNLEHAMASGSSNGRHNGMSTDGVKDIANWTTEVDILELEDVEVAGSALALHNYEPRSQRDELRLRKGQTVIVSRKHKDGWLIAKNSETGEHGLVPEHCLQFFGHVKNDQEKQMSHDGVQQSEDNKIAMTEEQLGHRQQEQQQRFRKDQARLEQYQQQYGNLDQIPGQILAERSHAAQMPYTSEQQQHQNATVQPTATPDPLDQDTVFYEDVLGDLALCPAISKLKEELGPKISRRRLEKLREILDMFTDARYELEVLEQHERILSHQYEAERSQSHGLVQNPIGGESPIEGWQLSQAQRRTPTRQEFVKIIHDLAQRSGTAHDQSPIVEGKSIDLYALWTRVDIMGGFDRVNKEDLWTEVAWRWTFPPKQYSSAGVTLKRIYMTAIAEFDHSWNQPGFQQQEHDPEEQHSALDEQHAAHQFTLTNYPELASSTGFQGGTHTKPLEQLGMAVTLPEPDHISTLARISGPSLTLMYGDPEATKTGHIESTKRLLEAEDLLTSKQNPFPCLLVVYGCDRQFSSRKQWKRHIQTQHVQLEYWRCTQCLNGRHGPEQDKDFNRKDLFTQHIFRMHSSQSEQSAARGGKLIKSDVQRKYEDTEAERCRRRLRQAPRASRCILCDQEFTESWEESLEHIGRHLETAARQGHVDELNPRNWHVDNALQQYLQRENILTLDAKGYLTLR
ncbi:hypothetical protein CKM354_000777400 [Cercospora kikuchii]|uniref:SH3 domain-containing protein n=1 Tax=Cercospora kikuchii TaxID=84275 RepID=A0A9P3FJ15_9PEZI|nr:uncharacterized protein CKM354_000777400 [Cercospora kikuchii]GIZ44579.1 hypothetical protein CKM354_000777400 [Cercospora kikuchii]